MELQVAGCESLPGGEAMVKLHTVTAELDDAVAREKELQAAWQSDCAEGWMQRHNTFGGQCELCYMSLNSWVVRRMCG